MIIKIRTQIAMLFLLAAWSFAPGSVMAADVKTVNPTEKDRCPVCGMFVAKYPDWIAEVLFTDGSYAVFDGARDMFKYLADLKQYAPGKGQEDIGAVLVNDYYAVKSINGFEAYYVVGSDVLGPMGRELIPFEREQDAKEFMQDHRGGKILRFNEVTPVVLRTLDH
jgi:nitrous oxide reductase accessory protein NosL